MNPRKLLRIARWEITKNETVLDKRTGIVAALGVVILAVIVPITAGGGPVLAEDIYRVGVTKDSRYYDVVASEEIFAVRPDAGQEALKNGEIELLIRDGTVQHAPSAKGRAAREKLLAAISRYNDQQFRREDNRTAAFPVSVVLRYEQQDGVLKDVRSTSNQRTGTETVTIDDESNDTIDSGAGDEMADSDDEGEDTSDGVSVNRGDDSTGIGDSGVFTRLTGGFFGSKSTEGSPSNISPPFPFQSLALAFAFIIPLNFLIQPYGSSIFSERINRRGEMMLASPVSRVDIVGGKTLPYVLGTLVIEGVVAVGIMLFAQGKLSGFVTLVAVTPLVALFFATAFLGTMLARSFKEMTFLTDTIAVPLTSYAVFPAVFTEVNPIALISPLTLIVRNLQGQAITPPEFLFSTIPPLLSALVLFGLGIGLYREEDMFSHRELPLKLLDALAVPVHRRWQIFLLVAVLLPFVFVLELLAIATLFALGRLSIPLVIVVVVVIEELAKSLPIYAAYAHDRFDRRIRTVISIGTLAGLGFFLGERITLLAQFVGLSEVPVGQAGLQIGILPGIIGVIVPLILHVVTACISSVGASRGRRPYAIALAVAILGHLVYIYMVVIAGGV